jgi:hypothetical protein
MKLVIDSNALQSEELRTFLSNSKGNFAVLPDFVGMEAYKGDPLKTVYKSMAIVSDFPNQVIILKGSAKVCGLSGRRKGLQRRLIDDQQTAGFADHARALHFAKAGNVRIQEQIRDLGEFANAHLNNMRDEAENIRGPIGELGRRFSKEERSQLRAGEKYSSELVDKVVRIVMELAALAFRDSRAILRKPSYQELPNTFIFRVMFATFLHSIRRFSQGGFDQLSSDKLANDFVDMMFVAYGSYFDGGMSSDKNVKYMFNETCLLLPSLLDAEVPYIKGLEW